MSCQYHGSENRNRNRVPIEQSDVTADVEVCEEGNQEIGADENEIPIRLPKAIVDVSADFERDTAQNQTPQNQKEGEIVTGKSRSHQAREDRDQCSAETEEPYLMPCP